MFILLGVAIFKQLIRPTYSPIWAVLADNATPKLLGDLLKQLLEISEFGLNSEIEI